MYQSISLTNYIDEWLTVYKATTVKPATYDRLLTSVRALEGFEIANMPIAEITSAHIQQYVNELAGKGYGLSTIKKQMRIVTAPLKQASALHLIPADPGVGIKLPARCHIRKTEASIEAYSPDEQKALRAQLETLSRPAYAVILLMLETGLRAGEALALRWRDIHLTRKRLEVHSTVVRLANKKQSFVQDCAKSEASNRTIPLTPYAVRLLERLSQGGKGEWVFTNTDGERLSYEALRWQTNRVCRDAGVDYKGEHVFRHTFATNCYYKKIDIKILSRLLGHADVNITYNVYIHLYGDGFDEMYSALVG